MTSLLNCDVPVFVVPTQSSSDYVSPYELPLVAQTPVVKTQESEAPAEGESRAQYCFCITQGSDMALPLWAEKAKFFSVP